MPKKEKNMASTDKSYLGFCYTLFTKSLCAADGDGKGDLKERGNVFMSKPFIPANSGEGE